ncbi:hypothetical protein BOX15_Mlig010448g4, partial [Macrostomum lignano]
TQSIVVQVGQCGNQIGSRFWDLALREHASVSRRGDFDDSLGTFFRQQPGEGQALKARAVLVDMEEGVVGELLKGRLRGVFDHSALITDVSGSGNNWAVGHCEYGLRHREALSESIRRCAEQCDCLQCFFLLHSMGGGTGSGLGTAILQLLRDQYPEVYRFVTAVYPSEDDDVITSPYNSVLAMRCLTDYADCVMPIDNACLAGIAQRVQDSGRTAAGSSAAAAGAAAKDAKPFDAMNSIVANLLLNLTASARFSGTLNVDLNEISMNLVPFPRLHYLLAAQSPLSPALPPRRPDQAFNESFGKEAQLFSAEPRAHLYLACALLLRGRIDLSDVRRCVDRLGNRLAFADWNPDCWKIGHCAVPPAGQQFALLSLANNTAIGASLHLLGDRFSRLYKRRAHLHHYTQVDGFEAATFDSAFASLNDLREDYAALERRHAAGASAEPPLPRLKIAS